MSLESKNVNILPISYELHNPWVIDTWRMDTFRQALKESLPESFHDYPEVLDLVGGCAEAAHAAGKFNAEEGVKVFPREVQQLIRVIGAEQFKDIYDSAPPEEVIDFALTHVDKFGRRMVLDEITVEVLRGRMEWEDRFAEAGVPTPEEYIAKQALQRIIKD